MLAQLHRNHVDVYNRSENHNSLVCKQHVRYMYILYYIVIHCRGRVSVNTTLHQLHVCVHFPLHYDVFSNMQIKLLELKCIDIVQKNMENNFYVNDMPVHCIHPRFSLAYSAVYYTNEFSSTFLKPITGSFTVLHT